MKDRPRLSDVLSPSVVATFKDQLLICMVKRLADKEGILTIPVSEVDNTGQDTMDLTVNEVPERSFTFTLRKKS